MLVLLLLMVAFLHCNNIAFSLCLFLAAIDALEYGEYASIKNDVSQFD